MYLRSGNKPSQTGRTTALMVFTLLCSLLMAPYVSAWEWDNIYSVSGENEELVTIKNAFGLGRDLAYLELTWGNTVVPVGIDTHVGTFTIEFTDEGWDDTIFDELELINLNNGKIMTRGKQLKVKTIKQEDKLVTTCTELWDGSIGDYNPSCTTVEDGKIDVIEWVPISNPNLVLNAGVVYEIGIFVDTEHGDYGDWVPDLMGVKINEWAEWRAWLDTGLTNYYDMEDNVATTNVIDQIDGQNGTIQGGENSDDLSISGKYLLGLDMINTDDMITAVSDIAGDTSISVAGWFTSDCSSGLSPIVTVNADGTTSTTTGFLAGIQDCSNGKPNLLIQNVAWGSTTCPDVTGDGWHHFVLTRAGNEYRLYLDGNTTHCASLSNAGGSFSNDNILGGRATGQQSILGAMDEYGIWSITVNSTAITDLYNSGDGRFYNFLGDNVPEIAHVAPTNTTNYTVSTVSLNVTATDDKKVDNVTLYINDAVNNTDTSGVNGSYGWRLENLNDGNYTWFASVWDNNSQQTNMSTYYFQVDATSPAVTVTDKNFSYAEMLTNNQVINITYTEVNPDDCWYDYSGTNVSFTCTDLGFLINLSIGNQNITVYMNDTFGNENSDFMSWSVANTTISFRAIDTDGDLISQVQFGGNISYTGNPYTDYMSSFINETNTSINITINVDDLGNYNKDNNFTVNINSSYTVYNLTLQPNQLILTFYNGTQTNTTKFEIYDGDKLIANESNTVTAVANNLTENGRIRVRFNQDNFGVNWTQYYEYINVWSLNIDENITLMNSPEALVFFEVKSVDGRVISDAQLRAEYAQATSGNTVFVDFIGQRLTENDGTTSFWFEDDSMVTVTITATGFDAKTWTFPIGDLDADTKAEAQTIYLTPSSSGINHNVWVYYPLKIDDKTEDIEGMIIAKSYDKVEINTDWRVGQGLGERELSEDGQLRGIYDADLTSGTDFSTADGDVIVYIYIDDVNVYNWTIDYVSPTEVWSIPNLNTDVIAVVGGIALIFIAGVAGIMFTSVTAGFSVFMIGSIFLSLVNTVFLWLTAVCVLYFTLIIIRRVFSE